MVVFTLETDNPLDNSRLACEQALLFGRVKRVSRERASERRSREARFACPNRRACSQTNSRQTDALVNRNPHPLTPRMGRGINAYSIACNRQGTRNLRWLTTVFG